MYKKKKKKLYSKQSVYQSLQVEAIYNALTSNPAFFERKVRRWFSKNFNTPLPDTFKLPWDEILIHYYESTLEDRNHNELFDLAMDNYLPEFVNRKEEQDEAFAQSLIDEQELTLSKKRVKTRKEVKKAKVAKSEQSEGKDEMNLNFNEEDFEGDKS